MVPGSRPSRASGPGVERSWRCRPALILDAIKRLEGGNGLYGIGIIPVQKEVLLACFYWSGGLTVYY